MYRLTTLLTIIAVSTVEPFIFTYNLPLGSRIFENHFNQTLSNLSESLSQYDPISIPLVALEIKNGVLKGKFRFEDVVVIGFSNFIATNLKINLIPPSAIIELLFPKIHIVSAVYDFDMKMAFVPLYGKGGLSLFVKNTKLGCSGTVDFGAEGVSGIHNMNVIFNVSHSVLHVSGLLGNEPLSQIVSTSTTECFPKFIKNYGTRLGKLAALVIENIINYTLYGKAIEDVIPQKGSINEYLTGYGTSIHYRL